MVLLREIMANIINIIHLYAPQGYETRLYHSMHVFERAEHKMFHRLYFPLDFSPIERERKKE